MPPPLEPPNPQPEEEDLAPARRSLAFRFAAGFILAWTLVVVMAQTTTLVDYNSQLKNKPQTYVCVPGAAAVQGIPYCLTQVATGGTVVIPKGTWALASTVVVSNNGITIQVQGTIQPSANVPVFNFTGTGQTLDGMGVGIVNGRASQDGRTANCINASGTTGLVIKNLTITNCGFYGGFLDGSVSGNSHVKSLNNTFTNNLADAIFSRGSLTDFEVAGGNYDCSSATFSLTHCIGIHAAYDNNPSHYGTVANINLHDYTETMPGRNDSDEIGSFVNATPVPYASLPNGIHSTNVYRKAISGSGFGFSCSGCANLDESGDITDAGGFANVGTFEYYNTETFSIRGIKYVNPSSTSGGAITLENGTSNGTISHSVFYGSVDISTGDPLFALSNQQNLTFANNTVILNSAGPSPNGAFRFAPNQVATVLGPVKIVNNTVTGAGTSDGNAMVYFINGGLMTFTQFQITDNSANNIQCGYNNTNGNAFPDIVLYTGNILGSGTADRCSSSALQGVVYNNPGFPSNQVPTGALPTVVLGAGAGAGATYVICNGAGTGFNGSMTVSSSSCPGASTPYAGYIIVTAAGTPATPNSFMQLTVEALAFNTGPTCSSQIGPGNNIQIAVTSNGLGNTSTLITFYAYGTAPVAAASYSIGYQCSAAN